MKGADLGCVAGGGGDGRTPKAPRGLEFFISELKMAHFWCILAAIFSAQLRLLLYLQKIGHYWTAKTSCS